MNTDHIDLYQAHDLEFGDFHQVINETFPAMRKLQEQGKVRFIGVTGYPPKVLMQVARAVYCKLSGMVTEADRLAWAPEDPLPYIDVVLEAFNPACLMAASDCPCVCSRLPTHADSRF